MFALVASMVACSINEIELNSALRDDAISLTPYQKTATDLDLSRGSLVSSAQEISDMGVYAYDQNTCYINNAQASKYSSSEWAFTPVLYWPDVEGLDFLAYSPWADDNNDYGLSVMSEGKDTIAIEYTVPTDVANQPDLMVSEPVYGFKNQVVSLEFSHALSSISFCASGDGTRTITDVKLKNIYSSGVLSLSSDGAFQWGLTKSSYATNDYFAGVTQVAPTDTVDITTNTGYLMMIPQELSSEAMLEVTLKEGDNSVTTEQFLLGTSITWQASYQYRYHFTITSEQITLSEQVVVSLWAGVVNLEAGTIEDDEPALDGNIDLDVYNTVDLLAQTLAKRDSLGITNYLVIGTYFDGCFGSEEFDYASPSLVSCFMEYAPNLTSLDLSRVSYLELLPGSFYCEDSHLVDLSLPASLTKVSDYAFVDCVELDSLFLPNVVEFDLCAVQGCSSLVFIELSSENDINFTNTNLIDSSNIEVRLNINKNNNFSGAISTPMAENYSWADCQWRIVSYTDKLDYWDGVIDLDVYTSASAVKDRIVELFQHEVVDFIVTGEYFDEALATYSDALNAGGSYFFEYAPNVQSVDLSGVKNLTIPNNLFATGEEIYNYSDNTTADKFHTVVLPDYITEVPFSAFYGCVNLKNINLENIVSVGESAFSYCFKLNDLDFSSLESVSYDSFLYCEALTTLSSEKLTNITERAFAYCSSLSEISLPNLQTLEPYAFVSCSSLKQASFENVETLSNGVFYLCTSLESVSMPSVTTLELDVFVGCTKLSSVSLPLLTTMKGGCFQDCVYLQSINLPSLQTITTSGAFAGCVALDNVSLDNLESAYSYDFAGCTSLREIYLPKLKAVSVGMFSSCTSLVSVDLPLIESIGNFGFESCKLLKDFTHSSVLSLGSYAFYDCLSLESVSFENALSYDATSFQNLKTLKSVSMPNVTYIMGESFMNCSALESVDFKGATHIFYCAFSNCTSLESLYLPNMYYVYVQALNNCTNLTTLDIGENSSEELNITDAQMLFIGTENLQTVKLHNISTVNEYIFFGAENLSHVELASATEIGTRAFAFCSRLKTIIMPNVETVNNRSFYQCYLLESVYIPQCSFIDEYAFAHCTSLSEITYSSEASVSSTAFENCISLNN